MAKMSLSGKVALVTGGATGIGKAISETFADEGVNLVLAARNLPRLQEYVDTLKTKGIKAIAVQTDISDYDQVQNLVSQAINEFGKIDILVNNSGLTAPDRFVDISLRRWNMIVNVNLSGTAYCTHAVLPHMIEKNSGVVINMSSILALRVQYSVVYGATKAALERFTTGLAREMRKTNVSITAMRPYFVKTDAVTEFLEGKADMSDWEEPEMWGKYCAMISAAEPTVTTGKIFDQALCKETFGPWQ